MTLDIAKEQNIDFIKQKQREILFGLCSFFTKDEGLCINPFWHCFNEELEKETDKEYIKKIYRAVFQSFKCSCFNQTYMAREKKYPFEIRNKGYEYLEDKDKKRLEVFVEDLVRNAEEVSNNLLALLCDKRMEEFIF